MECEHYISKIQKTKKRSFKNTKRIQNISKIFYPHASISPFCLFDLKTYWQPQTTLNGHLKRHIFALKDPNKVFIFRFQIFQNLDWDFLCDFFNPCTFGIFFFFIHDASPFAKCMSCHSILFRLGLWERPPPQRCKKCSNLTT